MARPHHNSPDSTTLFQLMWEITFELDLIYPIPLHPIASHTAPLEHMSTIEALGPSWCTSCRQNHAPISNILAPFSIC